MTIFISKPITKKKKKIMRNTKPIKVDEVLHMQCKVHAATRNISLQAWIDIVLREALRREALPELAKLTEKSGTR